ncbi:MAG: 2-hydroxyacyl-CoA dehydratase family protein, partial [Oscillospiraceae bacterium]|nr:2-hydroxyacyl-CoA dehydratase family protein [Oscillospiraceae bacterium]
MAQYVDNTSKVLSGEMSTMDYICDTIESKYKRCLAKDPDALWSIEIQKATWFPIRDAKRDGKKLIFFGGPVPLDIIYAFDCQPYYLDQLPLSLAPNVEVASKYIDLSEGVANQSMCAISKIELGALLAGQYGVEPDAFVYSTVPCDSSRIAYPNMQKILGKPTFNIDTPFRRDQRGVEYLVRQTKEFIAFMEDFTGTKLDWDKLKYRMDISNKTNDLLVKCANLRKHMPCPLPGRLLIANSCMSGQSADPALVDFLRHEYEAGQMMVELGMGA